jgi:hypothetical protein
MCSCRMEHVTELFAIAFATACFWQVEVSQENILFIKGYYMAQLNVGGTTYV